MSKHTFIIDSIKFWKKSTISADLGLDGPFEHFLFFDIETLRGRLALTLLEGLHYKPSSSLILHERDPRLTRQIFSTSDHNLLSN